VLDAAKAEAAQEVVGIDIVADEAKVRGCARVLADIQSGYISQPTRHHGAAVRNGRVVSQDHEIYQPPPGGWTELQERNGHPGE
jgi:hypothetical protein